MLRALRSNEKGQSSVEYIIVTSALVAALITMPSIYDTISHTMQDKYKSYAFGVSISDPPSKQFDDKVHKVADIIKQIEDLIEKIGAIFTDIFSGKLPSVKDFKSVFNDLWELIKTLF